MVNARKKGHINISNVQQAKATYAYQNKKQELLKTKAAIWFNKMCRHWYIC